MTKVYRIPLSNVPQRISIELGGRSLILIRKWNDEMVSWVLDILDGQTEDGIIAGLPLVPGTDLLSQHRHLALGGALVVAGDGGLYFVSE